MDHKYRKKPVVIEAFQLRKGLGDETGAVPAWGVDAVVNGAMVVRDGEMYIKTLEGEMHASDGDWIIRGVKGELYHCKPDIFAALYDPA